MSKDEMGKTILEYKAIQIILKDKLRKFVQDKSIDLEDRWQFFIESDLGDKDSYCTEGDIDGLPSDYSFYDDFNIDKYQTVSVDSFIEQCEDKIKDEEEEREISIDINQIKEWFLSKFIKEFTFNW